MSTLRFLLLLMPLATALSPTPCVKDVTWTVTSVQLADFTTINPLSGYQWDQRRTLKFHVESKALPEPHACEVDSLWHPKGEAPQFDEWTYECWKGDVVPIYNPNPRDLALSFKFNSAYADTDSEHPAKFGLKQEVECGSEMVELEGSLDITMSCGLPYLPYGCGPCLEYQCNGTTTLLVNSGTQLKT